MQLPTNEQVAAFKQAWQAEDERLKREGGGRSGDRTRAGLQAMLPVIAVQIEHEILKCAPVNMELNTLPHNIGTERPIDAAYVEGVHAAFDAVRRYFGRDAV